MDKKFLKENKLLKAHEQFMKLCEWSYVPQNLEEEGDEDDAQDDSIPQGEPPIGDDMGGQGDEMSQQQEPQDNGMGMDANVGGTDQMPMDDGGMGQDAPQMGDDASQPMMNEPMPPMGDMEQEDDTVIDVDDITDAQEKMNDKVNHVGRNLGDVDDKITALMQSLSKMEQMINSNNDEIEKFKQEFEKRNPTDTEKLNLRSLDSYPFNVNMKEYWKEKSEDPNSNYSAYFDNDKPTTDEYEITNNDVDDFSEREIEDSFDADDDLDQDIKKIFNLR